jgi:hypothetical protein
MSAITIILASLSALGLAILILAAVDDRKRQQRLGPMKLGATRQAGPSSRCAALLKPSRSHRPRGRR